MSVLKTPAQPGPLQWILWHFSDDKWEMWHMHGFTSHKNHATKKVYKNQEYIPHIVVDQ